MQVYGILLKGLIVLLFAWLIRKVIAHILNKPYVFSLFLHLYPALSVVWLKTFTFMHLADTFIQSDLQCIQVIHFCQYLIHNLCAANAMHYHWATGKPVRWQVRYINIRNPYTQEHWIHIDS